MIEHSTIQHFFLLLFISSLALFLTACGLSKTVPSAPVSTVSVPENQPSKAVSSLQTITPSPTAQRPAATPAPTAKAQPSATPTRYLFPTPLKDPGKYQLQRWCEEDAKKSIEAAKEFICSSKYEHPETLYHCDDFDWYRDSMLQEMLTRFPQSDSIKELNFQWALFKAYASQAYDFGNVHDKPVDPFRILLENALNTGETKPESIKDWLKAHFIEMDVQQFESARGLIENNTQAWAFIIGDFKYKSIFVLEETVTGQYRLLSLAPNWESFYWSDEKISITDLNGNSRPEITVNRIFWGSGVTHVCGLAFTLYEWNGQTFVSLVDEPIGELVNSALGRCTQLSFEPGPTKAQMILAQTPINWNQCGEDHNVLEKVYRWNGQKYVQEKAETRTIQIPAEIACDQINWALNVGFDHPLAAQIMEKALKSWPKDATEHWGPAAEDFFRFRWAFWLYKKGRIPEAREELQKVRDHPADPGHQKLSYLADLFLIDEKKAGPVFAVLDINQNIDADYKKYITLLGTVVYDTHLIQEVWGYVDDSWKFGYFSTFELEPFFVQAIRPADVKTKADLASWFEKNRINYAGLEQADIDGNGSNDWLALVGTQSLGKFELWALLQAENGIDPVLIKNVEQTTSVVHSRVQTFFPDQKNKTPVTLYQWDDKMIAFHLSKPEAGHHSVVDLDPVHGSEARSKIIDWKLQTTPEGIHLFANYDNAQNEYIWDQNLTKLIPIGFSTVLQEENLAKAEQFIYRERKYAQAIEVLKTLLEGKIRENLIKAGGDGIVNPPRIRPYALYLLGLAYELNDDETNAIQTYWKLWMDYPESPYVLVIVHKLNLTAPTRH